MPECGRLTQQLNKMKISDKALNDIKKNLPGVLEQSSIMSKLEIAVALGFRSRQILWLASKKDPEIKELLDEYDKNREPNLMDAISGTWTHRMISGTAQGTEYIFYMMNKFPNEYKDMRISRNMHMTVVPDDKKFRDEFFGLTSGEKEQGADPDV